MNTHVFIVDQKTFKVHLEYMFAGTGAKDKKAPFLTVSTAYTHHATERNLIGMIADISRIRKEDNIIFYLQSAKGQPGMFYGVFKAASGAFFDENDSGNYLKKDLGKALSFRIKIKPYEVFPLGVTEHEALDSLEGKEHPHQLCWSLIYRKLKGARGCTMITDYEYEDLYSKLSSANKHLKLQGNNFSFDSEQGRIILTDNYHSYEKTPLSISVTDRLIHRALHKNAFETHLQAYILQNFDTEPLRSILLPAGNSPVWIGNEVSCGVGMQRIDIMTIQKTGDTVHIKAVELKDEAPYCDIVDKQLPWYIKWISEYVAPNYSDCNVIVYPAVIAKATRKKQMIDYIKSSSFLHSDSVTVMPTELIGFTVTDSGIEFKTY